MPTSRKDYKPIDDSVAPTKHPDLSVEACNINKTTYVSTEGIKVEVVGVAYAHEAKKSKEKVVFKILSEMDQPTFKCTSVKKFNKIYLAV